MAKHCSEQLEAPFGEKRILLHTCCAPCSSAIVEALIAAGIEPVIYYCNPNIYPREEYEIRKNECTKFALSQGLEIIDADYDHEAWRCQIAGLENEPERGGRCLKCFKMRLLDTARYAAANGFRVITTTLASSRWKSIEQINEAGIWACGTVNAENGFAVGSDASHAADALGSGTDFFQSGVEGSSSGDRAAQSVVSEACGQADGIAVSRTVGDDRSGVIWWDRNWRKNGLQDRRNTLLKQYGFYNQQYCGCEFSMRPACSADEPSSDHKVE